MSQCKPCIKIRQVLFIIKENLIMCYYNILKDIKSYSTINASVCVLDKPVKPVTFDEAMNKVRKIKEEAAKNYDPEAWDKIDAQIAENKKV